MAIRRYPPRSAPESDAKCGGMGYYDGLASELIHRPDKPVGVYAPGGFIPPERKFNG
ncbi:MAG: hypothetical protein U9N73_12590 [Candidatus Auribacterota bacterium]|nr:hypothetical protein [Candidatus Auribacterota bacterium]